MDHVTTRRTALRPPNSDGERRFVHDVLTHPLNSGSFVWHGSTPSVAALFEELEPATLLMHVVRTRRSQRPIGVVLLTNPNLRDGHGFVTVAASPLATGRGLVLEGLIGLIHLAFTSWPFHKLYADVDDASLTAFATAVGRYLVPEGRFHGHHVREGRRVDIHRLALYRTTWIANETLVRRTMAVTLPAPTATGCDPDRGLWAPP